MNSIWLVIEGLSAVFVLILGLGVVACIWLFFVDYTQKHDAIRQNYPVIGRFRGLFTKLGEFFRQYFFAMDREEMPFNRAHRSWVSEASEARDPTIAFGSTKSLTQTGTILFINDPFPAMDTHAGTTNTLVIGPTAQVPYRPSSFFNISAMSFGALSRPAVQALSRGAKQAGCWLNTGKVVSPLPFGGRL